MIATIRYTLQIVVDSVKAIEGGVVDCVYCGGKCSTKCGICGFAAHNNPSKGTCKGRQCMLHMDSDGSFGLAYTNQKELFGGTLKERKAERKSPTLDEVKRNALLHIEKCAKPKSKYDLRNALNDNNMATNRSATFSG